MWGLFCPTDFTDLHRFSSSEGFSSDFPEESEAFLLVGLPTEFRGCDLSGRCRYPLRLDKVPQIYTDSGLVRSLEKNTQISQMTQFFCLDIWGILLSIMARMNLCKSVVSVGLLKRLTFSAFFNTLLPALFLPA